MPSVDASRLSIRAKEHIRPAAEYLRDSIFSRCGLRIAATENLASSAPMIDAEGHLLATTIFGWKQSEDCWWQDARSALRTPVAEACRLESRPFWANKDGAWDECGNKILPGFDFGYFATVRNGASIVIPVHLPFSQIGVVTLSCPEGERTDFAAEISQFYIDFFILGHLFINNYVQFSAPSRWLQAPCVLTRREVACLRWVARGKTDDEIAVILERARPTVRFHLQNAAAKLGATNRSQSVFRAAQLGYLTSGRQSDRTAWRSPPSGVQPAREQISFGTALQGKWKA